MYVWVMFSTYQISVRTQEEKRERGSMVKELFEGFNVVKNDTVIFYILILCLVVFIWGVPYQTVFVPLIAKRELGLGSSGFGVLITMVGVGALIGSLAMATIGERVRRRGLVMLGMLVVYSVALLVLSRGNSLYAVIPMLLVSGAMQTSFMSLNNAYVLGRTPRELQGRVMSLFSLDRGLVPLGATIAGVLAEVIGPQDGLAVMGAICLGTTLLLAVAVPSLRRIT
jgi:predicted MFS family arabinose efflux permease